MAGLKGQVRTPRTTARLRRNSSRLATEAEFVGVGQVIALDEGVLVVVLDTDPGLENNSGALRVKIKAASGIVRDADGLSIDATAFIGPAQVISLSSGVLALDLATDPGLENSSGALQVKIKAASGVIRDADGLSIDATALAAATEADKGVVNQSAARVDSGEDTVTLTSVTTSITDPADTPATADALRDDLVTNALSEIGTALGALATRDTENETAIETLATEFNDLLAKLRTAGILNT